MVAFGAVHSTALVDGLSRNQIVRYAGASGDNNPLHTDGVCAREVAGPAGVFAQNIPTMAMRARLVTEQYPLQAVARFGGRSVTRVWPGDTSAGTTILTMLDDNVTVSLRPRVCNQDQTRCSPARPS